MTDRAGPACSPRWWPEPWTRRSPRNPLRAIKPARLLFTLLGLAAAGWSLAAARVAWADADVSGPARFGFWDPDSLLADSLAADSLLADSLLRAGVLTDPDSLLPDSLRLDSLVADSLLEDSLVVADTFDLAERYFPRRDSLTRAREASARLLPRAQTRPFARPPGSYWRQEVVLDSTGDALSEYRYRARETVSGLDARVPVEADLTAYREVRRREDARATFRDLADQRARRQQAGRGGFGITLDIPGGDNSAFKNIFGKNEVDLRVNGNATVDLGFAYQQNEQQEAITGQGGRLDPDFGQELGLSVRGTIGDKLRIDVNYDTQNTFEFENQVKLLYEGYDDEIVRRVEAGNVFLQTPSDLIQGGQRLFGIRTDLQLGGLQVTAVASQQDAESDELELSGGAQTTEFSLNPADYEDNTHFFVGYYFRNHWDFAHARPPNVQIQAQDGFSRISQIKVWISDQSVVNTNQADADDDFTCAVALVDLAEPAGVRRGGSVYLDSLGTDAPAPNPDLPDEAYTASFLADVADGNNDTRALLEGAGLRDDDYAARRFRLLRPNLDYSYNPVLGTVSLERRMTESEVLAVQYTYLDPGGDAVTVGSPLDRASQGSNCNEARDRVILKLIRGDNPTPQSAFWDLTLRNIYPLGGRSINPEDFELNVTYSLGPSPQRTFPGVSIGENQTISQVLGLDRLDTDTNPTPDDRFDFIDPYTIDAGAGRLIFPYLEPFGGRVRQALRAQAPDGQNGPVPQVSFQAGDLQSALTTFAIDTLYSLKPERAEQVFPNLRQYAISGSYRSAVQSSYNLGFSVVEGSVEVRAGSQRLTEGVDYQVDYILGEVNITNQSYLAAGRDIRISFERNQFAAIGKKTLLGVRAGYQVSEDAELGATWMRLSERPLADKYRVGEEPISNQIYGFDARYAAEPRWMTRLTDALPFVQTRAPSFFEFKGEYARLLPGHPETRAFEQTREAIQELGSNRDFAPDERRGLSFVDDFEGTENAFSLSTAGIWRLAAAPSGAGPAPLPDSLVTGSITDPGIPSNWRGLFTWYNLSRSLYQRFEPLQSSRRTRATRFVRLTELFPTRDDIDEAQNVITPLDLYFDPSRRGPYNFNETIGRDEPNAFGSSDPEALQTAWGGMVQRLPDGYRDFDGRNNVEFVEMIVAVYGGRDGNDPVSDGGMLYVDLGRVSEDVLPDGETNREDGLLNRPRDDGGFSPYARLPRGQQNFVVDYDDASGVTEDLGLDGLRSAPGDGDYEVTEQDQFSDFLDRIGPNGPDVYAARDAADAPDPSGDDYYHYEDDYFDDPNRFPGANRASVQERFSRFFPATELNSFESQTQITRSGHAGNSREPDTENLSGATEVEVVEQFYRFEIPLDSARFSSEATNPFFVDRLVGEDGSPTEWALIRIPVRERETRGEFGDIADFSLIESIRIWTDGHVRPVTIRLAEIQLVGSQWIKSDEIGGGPVRPGSPSTGATELFVASVNNEENAARYAVPVGALVPRIRDAQGNERQGREQSLSLRVTGFRDRDERALSKTYDQRLDLTKYERLRMFVHGEGFQREDSMRVFVRLGTNEDEDYYEVEQPIYPFESERLDQVVEGIKADSLWQTNVPVRDAAGGVTEIDLNSINVPLSAFNELKVERDLRLDADPSDGQPLATITEPYVRPLRDDGVPPGARVSIVGRPSIKDVQTVVIGIRNAEGGAVVLDEVEAWFNELRVSGYDEEAGWSAYARSTVRLADFMDVTAGVSRETDGFGALNSALGDRTFQESAVYDLNGRVNVDKLLPERYGWSIPVSAQLRRSEATPRFAPRRGDIRVEELISQVEDDEQLTGAEKDERVAEIQASTQSVSTSRSVRIPISKSGSESAWLRYSIDALRLAYGTSLSATRSPTQRFSDQESWDASATYALSSIPIRTVRPFTFLGRVPLLSFVGDLPVSYLPQRFTFTTTARRNVGASQERLDLDADGRLLDVPDIERQRFLNPVRRNQTFTHTRGFDWQYKPIEFLQLTFRSDTRQTFSTAGQNSRTDLIVRDTTGALFGDDGFRVIADVGDFDINDDDGVDIGAPTNPVLQQLGVTDSASYAALLQSERFLTTDIDVRPAFTVLGDLVGGEREARTDDYSHDVGSTFTLPRTLFQKKWLKWVQPQPIAYNAQFNWGYRPLRGVGGEDPEEVQLADVRTGTTLRTGVQLRPGELFRNFGFYQALEEAQENADAAAQARRAERNPPARGGQTRPSPRPTPPDEGEAEGEEADEEDGGPRRPPLPNPVAIARRTFLALTGIDDFTITYTGSSTNESIGVDDAGYSFTSGLFGVGPSSLAYRLGFEERPDRSLNSDLVSRLDVTDQFADNHRVGARTSVEFSRDLRVDLTWDVNWDGSERFDYTADAETGAVNVPPANQNGRGNATVWAFGASYDAFLSRQEERFRADLAATPEGEPIQSDVLSNDARVADFRAAGAQTLGSFGQDDYFALPLPNWTVRYSGISRWPLFRSFAQNVTLNHGYSATYSTNYQTNSGAFGDGDDVDTRIGEYTPPQPIVSARDPLEAQQVELAERFQPLIGLNVSWKGGVQTDVAFSRSEALGLSAVSGRFSESNTDEITGRLTFQKTGLRLPIPFLRKKRINNQVRFSFLFSRAVNESLTYELAADLGRRLDGLEPTPPQPTASTRFTAEPRISYTVSNDVTLDVFVKYTSLESEGSQVPSSSTLNGGFSFRVSFSN